MTRALTAFALAVLLSGCAALQEIIDLPTGFSPGIKICPYIDGTSDTCLNLRLPGAEVAPEGQGEADPQ